ncbi:MAG TPA: DUF533 domain-containing protein [Alphaproteobacteria bacterium]
MVRLIRGTTYESAAHHVNKAKALSPFSAVAAAAYSRMAGDQSDRRGGRQRKPADQATPSLDDEEAVRVDFHAADARLIIRTMIAALAAAGESEARERERILAYLRDTGGTAAELAFAEHEMRHPASAEDLARSVASRETAVEIYAAALLATNAAKESSRVFLARLAAALRLEPEFVRDLHAKWDDPPPA